MKPLPAILIVDDDEDHRYVAQRAIARAKLPAEVRVAADGREALCLLGLEPGGSDPAPPSSVVVVLLDLRMPGMGGWDVLKRIREAEPTRRIPVVVVSSSNRPEDVRRSYELGANSFVTKRLEGDCPGAYLLDVVRYWFELNEAPRPRAPKVVRQT